VSIFKDSASYRPFTYPWAVVAEKEHAIDKHWHEDQVDLQTDIQQYYSANGLATPNVSHTVNKQILDKILCLFTEMDKAVGTGYIELLQYVSNNEIRCLLMTQAAREIRHQRGYALGAETFGFSDSDWLLFQEYVEMQDKIDLMTYDLLGGKEASTPYKFCVKISQILLGEGIGLFAAFTILLNYKQHGKIIGFNDINQWSLIDEHDHVTNNIKILKEAKKDLTEAEFISIERFIVDLTTKYEEAEHAFLDSLYEIGTPEQLPKEVMKDYISYLKELRLYQMELLDESEVRVNPVEWMEWLLTAPRHGNFFEKKVTDYSHTGLIGDVDYTKYGVFSEDLSKFKFKVYGRDSCPFCEKALELLAGSEVEYVDTRKDLSGAKFSDYFLKEYGRKVTTVPQIFLVDEQEDLTYVGGYEDLKVLL